MDNVTCGSGGYLGLDKLMPTFVFEEKIGLPLAAAVKQAKLGHRLILLDESGNWRGLGTALYLAQQGHQLTIVTPDPYVGKELTRTSADLPLRSQLKQLGAVFLVESVISQ